MCIYTTVTNWIDVVVPSTPALHLLHCHLDALGPPDLTPILHHSPLFVLRPYHTYLLSFGCSVDCVMTCFICVSFVNAFVIGSTRNGVIWQEKGDPSKALQDLVRPGEPCHLVKNANAYQILQGLARPCQVQWCSATWPGRHVSGGISL